MVYIVFALKYITLSFLGDLGWTDVRPQGLLYLRVERHGRRFGLHLPRGRHDAGSVQRQPQDIQHPSRLPPVA